MGRTTATADVQQRVRRRLWRVAPMVPLAAVLVWLLAPMPPVGAASVAVGVFAQFPTRVDVGATVPASITVINGSTGLQAFGPLTITDLTLVPSCGNFSPACDDAGADPGVFALSDDGLGELGTNCGGRIIDISVIDARTGRVRFAAVDGLPLIVLGPNIPTDLDTCRINFTVTALRPPAIDSLPDVPGVQTDQVAYVAVHHLDGTVAIDQGEDVTTLVGNTTTSTTVPTTTTSTTSTTTTTAPTTTTSTTTTTVPSTTTSTTTPPTTTSTTTTTTTTVPTTTTTSTSTTVPTTTTSTTSTTTTTVPTTTTSSTTTTSTTSTTTTTTTSSTSTTTTTVPPTTTTVPTTTSSTTSTSSTSTSSSTTTTVVPEAPALDLLGTILGLLDLARELLEPSSADPKRIG